MKPILEERVSLHPWLVHGLLVVLLLGGMSQGFSADAPAPSDQQAKAICLLNLVKYVDWPAEVFADTNSPFTIGYLGKGKVMSRLKTAAEGKVIGGRKVVLVAAGNVDEWRKCQVLFIGGTEKKHQPDMLKQLKAMPILTVGEDDQFLQQGGAINLVKKDGKIRFDVDVEAIRGAHLQISSLLLSLADNEQPKP